MALQKPFSVTAKNQLQLVTLLMKGNRRLVLLLFLTFRVLRNPSKVAIQLLLRALLRKNVPAKKLENTGAQSVHVPFCTLFTL